MMRLVKLFTTALFGLSCIGIISAQKSAFTTRSPQVTLKWLAPEKVKINEQLSTTYLSFEGAVYRKSLSPLPYFQYDLPDINSTVVLTNINTAPLSPEEEALLAGVTLPSEFEVEHLIGEANKKYSLKVYISTIRMVNGKREKLISFGKQVSVTNRKPSLPAVSRTYASNSILSSGEWFKIGVTKEGIYKLDKNFLSSIGLDPTVIDPRNIRVFGNGGGIIPQKNSSPRKDDLQEVPIYLEGEADGVFDENDYAAFYGQSQHRWLRNQNAGSCPGFSHVLNVYSDTTYYFITADLGPGLRVQAQGSSGTFNQSTSTSDELVFYENESTNLIKSGREWYGEKLEGQISSFQIGFNIPNINITDPVIVKTVMTGRADVATPYEVSSGTGSNVLSIPAVATGCYFCDYAAKGSTCFSFLPTSGNFTVDIKRNSSITFDASIAWLDYIEVQARKKLNYSTEPLFFRDYNTVATGNVTQFLISNVSSDLKIWEITSQNLVKEQTFSVSSSVASFSIPTDSLREFVAFSKDNLITPVFHGRVTNQNLHAAAIPEFLIIAHPKFTSEAIKLARLHEAYDSLSYLIVYPQQIYNEFSSGAQDVTGIRDFIKMFYDKGDPELGDTIRYVLLFGDGSFDNKYRYQNNSNYIPTFQSLNSVTLTESYVSDDYYSLLGDTEGEWDDNGDYGISDIGVGRFPVRTNSEASGIVNKVEVYMRKGQSSSSKLACEQSNGTMGDWRNLVSFVGDDEDSNTHMDQANQLANFIDTAYTNYNLDKIFLDSYIQESTPGGDRYPDVVTAINRRMEKGCLILNYTGHGGEVGLAHERILEIPQINSWENINNMPLVVTATCEFARFDDPERTSAGELVLLNPNGGGIALLTTVRLVYSTPNFYLNKKFYECVFKKINGEMPRLGDVFRKTKALSGNQVNNRNFTLLGDPALRLAYPKYNVVTTSFNNETVSPVSVDTIGALGKVTVTGEVHDETGSKLANFNGTVYPTVYDKPRTIVTLRNDGGNAYSFQLQKNLVYRGKASVINGDFSFSFVVPKDIAYQIGKGRISYYAENGDVDAAGNYEKFYVGGSDSTAAADLTGPDIRVFMNDSNFVYGGTTSENPKLFAIVADSNGINTVGNAIGHDIVAVLDENTDNAEVLNEYYQGELNSYQKGKIIYPYENLAEGRHTLKLKVWDVYNNSSESRTEFVVSKSADLALEHVLNYPNPFTTRTEFFFEHNQGCASIDVQIQIFTVSGKLVKTIDAMVHNEGFRSEGIQWDGRDDFGDKIGKGVYVYRVKVRNPEGSVAEKFEKLVILN